MVNERAQFVSTIITIIIILVTLSIRSRFGASVWARCERSAKMASTPSMSKELDAILAMASPDKSEVDSQATTLMLGDPGGSQGLEDSLQEVATVHNDGRHQHVVIEKPHMCFTPPRSSEVAVVLPLATTTPKIVGKTGDGLEKAGKTSDGLEKGTETPGVTRDRSRSRART